MYCFCRSSKTISVRIILLDETEFLHEIQCDLLGQSLLEIVFARLNLIETAYFGLRFLDVEGQTHWLDANARLSRQLRENKDIYELYFGVKFYAVDPCKLVEEITRYQFYLQLKQDVLQGRLPVAFDLAAQLGAYVVQSEIGDFDANKHNYGYVSEFRIMASQTKDFELRVADIHKQLKGIGPAQTEFNYLDKVKWLDMYGVDLHPVLGEDSVEYYLGLTPSGIIVLRNKTTVAHYYWPRIAKVYFKGRYFMLRVCDKNNEVSTYGFETPKKTACKHLWKCCVEHHAFFRLVRVTPAQPPANTGDFFSLGSRFRYSGRTERQATKDALSIQRMPPSFTRTPSRRQIRRTFDNINENKFIENDKKVKYEHKSVSIPQPAQSIPANLNSNNNKYHHTSVPDSPRSTRSAPWVKSQQRGLFGINSSPKSVRSASSRNGNATTSHRHRSSSVESHSSNDSRSGRRHRTRSKKISDNESEMSRGSGRSGRSHRKHRRNRSRHRSRDSGSDHGSTREFSYNDKFSGPVELIDSGKQWLEVQRKQAEKLNLGTVQQAAVVKSNTAPKSSHSSDTYNRNKKNRKHRSPTDSRNNKIWSTELTKHLQFDLVETSGMTEDQLREIPYTVVETQVRKRNNTNSLKVHKSAHGIDRVDRIRGMKFDISSLQNSEALIDGSIRSGSTNSSSRDFDRNNDLMRMMSSMSMGDFISPTTSNLNRMDSSGIRVSHEHTDSGLGADQDYAYSSERSSDSAKYGTNKSSGTSIISGNMNNNISTPLNDKSQQQQKQQQQQHYQQQQHQFVNNNNRKQQQMHYHSNGRPHNNHNNNNNMNIINNTAPVHTKTINNYNHNNNLYNRLINNNNTHTYNDHYTFSLNRLSSDIINNAKKGVGGDFVTSNSPYSGHGVEKTRGTKSDIGIAFDHRSTSKVVRNNSRKNSAMQKSSLPSVQSELSIYETTFNGGLYSNPYKNHSDMANNNSSMSNSIIKTTMPSTSSSAITFSKTGSKLLYSNKHRLEPTSVGISTINSNTNNNNNNFNNNNNNINHDNSLAQTNTNEANVNNIIQASGPLLYINQEKKYCRRTNTVYNNQTMQSSSDGLSGFSSAEKLDNTANSSSNTNCNKNYPPSKSSSLEIILTPIIQSTR
ncbi:unnamed protein product [Diamesa serratosioi]